MLLYHLFFILFRYKSAQWRILIGTKMRFFGCCQMLEDSCKEQYNEHKNSVKHQLKDHIDSTIDFSFLVLL